MGRPPLQLDLLKAAFKATYNKTLESVVLDELSFKTKGGMQVRREHVTEVSGRSLTHSPSPKLQIALLGEWRDQPNGGRTPDLENGVTGAGVGGFGGGAGGGAAINQQLIA